MIICPNCNHQNPEGAVQCEACYTPLPTLTPCLNCGAAVQTDASFCGQCGFDLRGGSPPPSPEPSVSLPPPDSLPAVLLEPLVAPTPLVSAPQSTAAALELLPPPPPPDPSAEVPVAAAASPPVSAPKPPSAALLHVQTNAMLELPPSLTSVHLGKPNERTPPDIDVSGFPHSEIVSRIHATIYREVDALYLEDMGSSNGTYVNNTPLPAGHRHRLQDGDRIALGKGDKVTFLFQTA